MLHYGQVHFLNYEDAINERIEHALRNLMELLEHIIRSQNNFAQSFMMRWDFEDLKGCANAEGIKHCQNNFLMQESADYRGYTVPMTDELCVVLTLNPNKSFLDKELLYVSGEKIVSLRNTDKYMEFFTTPLFFPTEKFHYSANLQLKTPYKSCWHLSPNWINTTSNCFWIWIL